MEKDIKDRVDNHHNLLIFRDFLQMGATMEWIVIQTIAIIKMANLINLILNNINSNYFLNNHKMNHITQTSLFRIFLSKDNKTMDLILPIKAIETIIKIHLIFNLELLKTATLINLLTIITTTIAATTAIIVVVAIIIVTEITITTILHSQIITTTEDNLVKITAILELLLLLTIIKLIILHTQQAIQMELQLNLNSLSNHNNKILKSQDYLSLLQAHLY